jgi:hypothetical protein
VQVVKTEKFFTKENYFLNLPPLALIETAALAANKQEYKRKQELTLQKSLELSLQIIRKSILLFFQFLYHEKTTNG